MSKSRRLTSDHPTREKILRATKELLWERGFEAMSPRDVMDRSGAGQGSLYHHFSGKHDLACAALAEMAAEEQAAMADIFNPRKPPLARIADYLTRERDALRGCRLARLANEAAMADADFRLSIAAYLDEIERHLAKALAEAQVSGVIAADADAKALAAMLLAVVEGGFVLARVHWDAGRMRQALAGAAHMIERLRAANTPSPNTP
jgi:AcrR family transcriptional regulator